jgi:hypothetical protein
MTYNVNSIIIILQYLIFCNIFQYNDVTKIRVLVADLCNEHFE